MISSNHLPHFSATYFIWVINGKITLACGHTHRIIGVMDEPLKTDKKGSRPNRDIFKQNLNMFTHTCQRMLIHWTLFSDTTLHIYVFLLKITVFLVKVNYLEKVTFVKHFIKKYDRLFYMQQYCHVDFPFKIFGKMINKRWWFLKIINLQMVR